VMRQDIVEKEVRLGMRCSLCNEPIEEHQLEFTEVYEIDGEYWHAECYAEYFDEVLEEV